MHKIKTPNTARRRGSLPELSDIESLINETRGLRLRVRAWTLQGELAETATALVDALSVAGIKLESLAEIVVAIKNRPRQRTRRALPNTLSIQPPPDEEVAE